jgi:hypothetical protein
MLSRTRMKANAATKTIKAFRMPLMIPLLLPPPPAWRSLSLTDGEEKAALEGPTTACRSEAPK